MWDELVAAALAVRQRAYAPYSHYQVGAALRGKSGAVYAGCNVENASYGLTQCAERAAITTAVAAGEREFTALVLAVPTGGTPCGACRQVVAEFCQTLPILIVDAEDPTRRLETNIEALLPGRFVLH
ncbi:MAG TPA: cytidine deaminase [Pirellulales bacterium]|nr:cytidine deaminase [Pirellulales bacterium]